MSDSTVEFGLPRLSQAVGRRRKGEARQPRIHPKQHLSCCHGGLPQPEQKAIGQLSREAEQHVRGVSLFIAHWVCL